MTVSFNINVTDIEKSILNQRLKHLGLTMDQWAQQVVANRIDGLTRPHKMEQARQLFDKFHSAPDELKQQLMAVEGKKG